MKKLSKIEAELKKALLTKKRAYSLRIVPIINCVFIAQEYQSLCFLVFNERHLGEKRL